MSIFRGSPFLDGRRALAAAVASVAALLLVVAYAVVPVGAEVSWAAASAPAAGKARTVSGTLLDERGEPVKGRVKIAFHNARGKWTKSVTVKVGKDGRFSVKIPLRTRSAKLEIDANGRSATKRIDLPAGRTVDVQATLPSHSSGLLPGLFPY